MSALDKTCASIREQIAATETQLDSLKRDLENAEKAAAEAKSQTADHVAQGKKTWPLLSDEYRRYGRQMIVPQFGLQGA